jgi:spore coat protein U-like protein
MHRFLRIATKQAVEYFASIRRTGAVVAPLLWLCAVSMAQAGTTTANLTATITVTAACTINAAALTFPATPGTSLLAAAVTGSTTVSVTCTSGSPYAIGMSNGGNYANSTRNMASGGNLIGYGLYVDPAYTYPWTTAAGNSACTTANDCYLGTGNGSAQSVSIYGQVPIIATAPPSGTYSDTVTMTITF